MTVSIIIPVYNRADILQETLDSIVAQTFTDWEVIAVDDGSNDNSIQVLQRFAAKDSRITFYHRPSDRPKGANACRNFGFTKASGSFVKWVDSDDLLISTALEEQLEVFRESPGISVCFGQGIFFNDSSREMEERWSRKVSSNNIQWDYIRNNVRWPIGGPLWKKNFFSEPPFNESLMNSQEWLMHGLQLLKLTPDDFSIMDRDIYLIRRGNVRMSSRRTSIYFRNQAKARLILLRSSFSAPASLKFRGELMKQAAIFLFHSVFSGK